MAAGAHTLTIGSYNNKKSAVDESTLVWIDDVGIHSVFPFVCGDGVLSPGEECDDGGTVDGDCCSSTCSLEPLPACTPQIPATARWGWALVALMLGLAGVVALWGRVAAPRSARA